MNRNNRRKQIRLSDIKYRKEEIEKWKCLALQYQKELLAVREKQAKDYLDSIWHTKKDRPIGAGYVVVSDGNGMMADSRIGSMMEHHRWAYLKDLLPRVKSPILPRHGGLYDDGCTKDRFDRWNI